MDKLEIFEKVVELIESNFNVHDFYIEESSNLKDEIELDSFDVIELSFIIERNFGITIEDEEVEHWMIIDDIVTTVQKYIDIKNNSDNEN